MMVESMTSSYESARRPGVTISVMHKRSAVPLIQEVVRAFRPTLIVELGHAAGGLTMALHDAAPKAIIRAFDRRKMPNLSPEQLECFNVLVGFVQADVLAPGGCPVVRNYLAWPKPKLLYCDDGDKTREVQTYAPLLGVGDMLGVHDWTPRPPTARSKNASGAVLTPLLEDLGFEPQRHEEFEAIGARSRFWIRRTEALIS